MMKPGRSHLGWAAVLLFCSLVAAPALARPPRGAPMLALNHAEQLGLDAATQETLQEIVSQSQARNEGLREELRAARREIRKLLETSTPDEAAVMVQADAAAAIEGEMHKNRLQAILDIRALLTPAQREELVRLVAERPRREGRGGHRRGLGACRAEQEQRCPEATDGRAVLGCLQEHWEALASECHEAFDFSKPRHRPQ